MSGTGPTELITGRFVGHEPDEFQNASHRDHETNGLEVNAGQWSVNGRVRTDRLRVSPTGYLLNPDPWQGGGVVAYLLLVL